MFLVTGSLGGLCWNVAHPASRGDIRIIARSVERLASERRLEVFDGEVIFRLLILELGRYGGRLIPLFDSRFYILRVSCFLRRARRGLATHTLYLLPLGVSV